MVFEEVFSERGVLLTRCRPVGVSKPALKGFVCVGCSIHPGLEDNKVKFALRALQKDGWLREMEALC